MCKGLQVQLATFRIHHPSLTSCYAAMAGKYPRQENRLMTPKNIKSSMPDHLLQLQMDAVS